MTEKDTANLVKYAVIGVGLYFVYQAFSKVNAGLDSLGNAINQGETAVGGAVTSAENAVSSTASDVASGAWNPFSLVP